MINSFSNREYTETDPEKETTISICMIEATNGYIFKGCGMNKKMAKYKACRLAIQYSLGNIF
jgi:hypothetical protein